MVSEEELLAKFWEDVSIPEGYYTQEHAVDCAHALEDPCEFEGTPREWQEQLDAMVKEHGGVIIGDFRVHHGHKVCLVALPIPSAYEIIWHDDGYWVASCAMDVGAETEEDVPSTIRIAHEGASKNKNTAIRRLYALMTAIMTDSGTEDSPMEIVIVPSDRFWPMPPGTIPGDTIFLQ